MPEDKDNTWVCQAAECINKPPVEIAYFGYITETVELKNGRLVTCEKHRHLIKSAEKFNKTVKAMTLITDLPPIGRWELHEVSLNCN